MLRHRPVFPRPVCGYGQRFGGGQNRARGMPRVTSAFETFCEPSTPTDHVELAIRLESFSVSQAPSWGVIALAGTLPVLDRLLVEKVSDHLGRAINEVGEEYRVHRLCHGLMVEPDYGEHLAVQSR